MSKPDDLLKIIHSGIDAVRPSIIFPRILNLPPCPELRDWLDSPTRFLFCLGKASLDSAETILRKAPCAGHFVLAPKHPDPSKYSHLNVYWGSHPIPDQQNYDATRELISWLRSLPKCSRLLVVLSGGASALLVSPSQGLSLESKVAVNDLLIRSGASIGEINTVRKHLSEVKGGRLAQLVSETNSFVLVFSDVIDDDPATIGSGPFYQDHTTFLDARNVLRRYGLWQGVPEEARQVLQAGVAGEIPDTSKQGGAGIPHYIVASNGIARKAAFEKARELGYVPHLFSDPVSGMVEEFAAKLSALVRAGRPDTAFILGGEITVRVQGAGIGGRNQHLALLLTELLAGSSVHFVAAGTDGIDGNSPAAGAWTGGETLTRAKEKHLEIRRFIDQCDSYSFFRQLGQNVITGPTGTNVMDLYVALT